jgi:hypothetical protein
MALLSILLAVLAFICTLLGFLTTPIPVVGLVFSFGAAAIALGGIMLGGRATSRAKRAGVPNDAARIAVVMNVLAFIPALLVAFTCGVCNALFSSGNLQVQKHVDIGFGPGVVPGFGNAGGAAGLPAPTRLAPTRNGHEPPDDAPAEPTQPAPSDAVPSPAQPAPTEPAQPAPGLPPPPLPAGPRK